MWSDIKQKLAYPALPNIDAWSSNPLRFRLVRKFLIVVFHSIGSTEHIYEWSGQIHYRVCARSLPKRSNRCWCDAPSRSHSCSVAASCIEGLFYGSGQSIHCSHCLRYSCFHMCLLCRMEECERKEDSRYSSLGTCRAAEQDLTCLGY